MNYSDDTALIYLHSECIMNPIDWVWNGWLAKGKMHILGGSPGTGKTTLALAMASTITLGGRWPDGTNAAQGNVMIWSGEDDISDTLVPRMEALGVDPNRMEYIAHTGRRGNVVVPFDPSTDIPALERSFDKDISLLIVDPIISVSKNNSNDGGDTRRSLQPLSDFASSKHCAVLGITHFGKGTSGKDPLERILGSIHFGAVARIGMAAFKTQGEDGEPDGRMIARIKSNIGVDGGGFRYDLQQATVHDKMGRPINTSTLLWGDMQEGTSRELLEKEYGADNKDSTKPIARAKDFLLTYLADGKKPSKEVVEASKERGISLRTLERARADLGVRTKRHGDGTCDLMLAEDYEESIH